MRAITASAARRDFIRPRSWSPSGHGRTASRKLRSCKFPADGRTFYGTQLSRQAWDAEQGELTEVVDGVERTLASYAAQPVALAEDSESADVTAELVDVGQGTQDSDYSGKEVRGKLVLVSAQPGEVQEAAIGKFKAAGIVSYAQNQHTAWWGEDENLVRWGHLDSFSASPTFAFMVSLKTARALQERLKHGDSIKLHAQVKAGQHPGSYEVVTGVIEGADPQLRAAGDRVFLPPRPPAPGRQ